MKCIYHFFMRVSLFRIYIIIIISILIFHNRISAQMIFDWTHQPTHVNLGTSQLRAVVADEFGNSVVTGAYIRNIDFGNFQLISSNSNISNMYVVKYDSAGNILWVNGCIGNSKGVSTAIDSHGSVYVTGEFKDSVHFGNTLITTASNNSSGGFIAKYDSSGNFLWVKTANPTYGGYSTINSIAIDTSDNIYININFFKTTNIFNNPPIYLEFDGIQHISNSSAHYVMVKMDTLGNVYWMKGSTHTGLSNQNIGSTSILRLVHGHSGDIYSIGTVALSNLQDSFIYPGNNYIVPGLGNIIVARFDTSGYPKWIQRFGGALQAGGVGIAADGYENIYFTGSFTGAGIPIGNIYLPNQSRLSSLADGYVVKLDSSGQLLWVNPSYSKGGSSANHV